MFSRDVEEESALESKAVSWAEREHGAIHRKLNGAGRSGWPDHIFVFHGLVVFVEFKRKGKKPRPIQAYTIEQLARRRAAVFWTDDLSDFQERIHVLLQQVRS